MPPRDEWKSERDALWRGAEREPVVAASGLGTTTAKIGSAPGGGSAVPPRPGDDEPDPGLDKEPSDDEETPVWRRGRYGTALGRAVHAVLQTVGLDASDEAVATAAQRYAAAEGIDHLADDVATRARNALATPVVRQAARQRHWQELYAGAEVNGRLLEGFIDLTFEAPDGSFVVVDYKTHNSDERPDLRAKPGYRLQIAAYALMLSEATGRAVSRCVFVFLGPNSAHEVEVEDLPAAIEEVRRILAADAA